MRTFLSPRHQAKPTTQIERQIAQLRALIGVWIVLLVISFGIAVAFVAQAGWL